MSGVMECNKEKPLGKRGSSEFFLVLRLVILVLGTLIFTLITLRIFVGLLMIGALASFLRHLLSRRVRVFIHKKWGEENLTANTDWHFL